MTHASVSHRYSYNDGLNAHEVTWGATSGKKLENHSSASVGCFRTQLHVALQRTLHDKKFQSFGCFDLLCLVACSCCPCLSLGCLLALSTD